MDKDRLKDKLAVWKTRLAFLKPWDMDEEFGEDLEIREFRSSDPAKETRYGRWKEKQATPEERRRRRIGIAAALVILVSVVGGGFVYYNGHHLFEEYVITSTAESLDILGTRYAMLGSTVVKYSSDGVFCVNTHNETKWSAAYSMQTPITDICEETMVIAEQQGNQVYVLNADGVLGSFQTSLPIMKANVSRKGVTALILEDAEVTWIELYDCSGSEIARIKTTVQDSGYPLDIAMSPDASRMMVSYLGVKQGKLNTRIAFYDFSSASDSDESHLTGTVDYEGKVFPEVYYADASTPVALSDTGFVVFQTGKSPEEKETVDLGREIISSFHDDEYVGFVFANEAADCRYEMELYRYTGKQVMNAPFDCDYTEIKLDRGEILLYDAKNCTVYTASGSEHFSSDYEKPVAYFAGISGFRRYLVITNDSMDRIQIS